MLNLLTSLPTLPAALNSLGCDGNPLYTLPALPASLKSLTCSYDSLTVLPAFPDTLGYIDCSNNNLTALPNLPVSLQYAFSLYCSHNNLTTIPALPPYINFLDCHYNPNLTCLPQLTTIYNLLQFDSTGITCLPNYGSVDSSVPPLNSVPLCGINNPGGCGIYWNISGMVFFDANADCQFNVADSGLANTKVMLYSNGALQQQTYTGAVGEYSFQAANYNTYDIVVDTASIPFAPNPACPDTGNIWVTLGNDSLSPANNFSFVCNRAGYDLGVQSIWYDYRIYARPATTFQLYNIAGDMTALYGARCATGVSGQVQLIISGPAAYAGVAPGALTPTVSGDTLTYTIADFGTVNPLTGFNILLRIDGYAVSGDQVCLTSSVTPTAADYNLTNNQLTYCITVVDAMDPNEKEVYPAKVDQPGQWLTYTIRFQNTGTAPAVNIVVKDTLSSSLDLSSFTLLNSSYKVSTQLTGNIATFTFSNINLVDSLVSDSASRGYVQFKIKTKSTFTAGQSLSNTAYIYFDLNAAVVTNTVTDTFAVTGITTPAATGNITVSAFPNPFNDITNIEITGLTGADKYNFELYDVTGRLQLSIPSGSANHFQITRGKLAAGIYTYRLLVGEEKAAAFGKLVIQ